MGKNHKRRKREKKQERIDKQAFDRALNFYVCDELRRVGSGNVEAVKKRIVKEVEQGKRKIPEKYFRR